MKRIGGGAAGGAVIGALVGGGKGAAVGALAGGAGHLYDRHKKKERLSASNLPKVGSRGIALAKVRAS